MKITKLERNPKINILNELKDKLLDLNPRSRKIRFNISKWLAWDLTELTSENEGNLVNIFYLSILKLVINKKDDKKIFSFDLQEFFKKLNPEKSLNLQQKITCLQKKNLYAYQEKGYKSLFLGTIFLRGYFYNNKKILRLINAPLFLLPCDLEKIKNLNLVFKSERKINHSLLYYLQKELSISKVKLTDFLNKLENNSREINKWRDYIIFLNNEIQQLFSNTHIKIKFSPVISAFFREKNTKTESKLDPFVKDNSAVIKNNSYAEAFVKLNLIDKPKNYLENELEIFSSFCLTIDSEPNLSLFHDFEEIIEEYSQNKVNNWSKSALNLLKNETENINIYQEKESTKNIISSLYTPFPSDPSQNHILRTIFQNYFENPLCINGPPGTGKTQLICNLLANSLFYQKKVLVICEKELALKVIYDKLNTLGLERSIIKINQLEQTSRIYQQIINSIEINKQKTISDCDNTTHVTKIANLEKKLLTNVKKIENYCEIEKNFQTKHQKSLQEIYTKFERKVQLNPIIIQLNSQIINQEQLEKLLEEIKNYIGKFTKIFLKWKSICLQLKNLFLENNFQEFKFDLETQNIFQEVVNNILKELKGEKTESNLISTILRINLLHQNAKSHNSLELTRNNLNELIDLQKNQQYRKFLIFLQVNNFDDFWKKCSNEEFLINIQQFINEEFLIIGELTINLDKETKKNINYLLKKILIKKEFNYLNDWEKITEQSVYFNWIKKVEEENKEFLATWNYKDIAKIYQEQKTITEKKLNLTKSVLKIEQEKNLTKLLISNNSLKKELGKKRKISPLKILFSELINYFPIWLSTPEVIASITNLQEPFFDFIIFDEASQITLEKTIPLWARAKKCIVIGDEQQLPPTDFFKSHLQDDEENWEEELSKQSESENKINLETDDLEKNSSLLNYAKKYSQNEEQLTLLYHYRSKYSELIEFSNQAFYNGVLQIISASENKINNYLPIEYHYQSKGKWINNKNQIEANYIFELLKTLPKNKEIGIITFNNTQRDFLIELIGENSENNNFFIKSLEEVQGDEKDIIIFCIAYARNKEDKIVLNFGPLSKEGGEKRLNVAITRAREKLIIVTSLLLNDLKKITEKDEKRKLGPRLFKKYLEYAYHCWKKDLKKVQNILNISIPKITNSYSWKKNTETKEFESLFTEQLYNELVKQKYPYEIHKKVKSVGYNIDIAIWDKKIQQYILGIECDSKYWHGKWENIEKDIYRQQILENKGWKIMRILSRDWSRNKEGEIKRINKELEQ